MTTLQFISRVGMHPPFFIPKAGDDAPAVTMAGPTGEFDLTPTDNGDGRWVVTPPEPYWATGVYAFTVDGDVFEFDVRKHSGRIMPDEAKRLAALSVEDHAAALSFINPEEN